jgi:hypothetical protein
MSCGPAACAHRVRGKRLSSWSCRAQLQVITVKLWQLSSEREVPCLETPPETMWCAFAM